MKKMIIHALLIVIIAVLGYSVYESIQQPIRFQEQYEIRKNAVVYKLIAIRSAEVAFNSINGRYTGSFDTLETFIKTAKLPLINMEGSLSDSLLEAGMTEKEALKLGIIKRDTIFVNAKDSLFKDKINIDSLKFVPFVKGGQKFQLKTGSITTGSGVKVQLFECKVQNDVFLKGLDVISIGEINDNLIKMDKFPGLRVGSVDEANNNAGNWE